MLAVLIIPMAIFQFGSASLDSVTFGLTALTGALFNARGEHQFPVHPAHAFGFCLVYLHVVITSRTNFIALTILIPVLFFFYRKI